jgi:hypothetical protein
MAGMNEIARGIFMVFPSCTVDVGVWCGMMRLSELHDEAVLDGWTMRAAADSSSSSIDALAGFRRLCAASIENISYSRDKMEINHLISRFHVWHASSSAAQRA